MPKPKNAATSLVQVHCRCGKQQLSKVRDRGKGVSRGKGLNFESNKLRSVVMGK